MGRAKALAISTAMALIACTILATVPAGASPGPTGVLTPMDAARPECNFTWLRADGVGTIGSTAMYIHDGDLDIFIEAFPASGTNWDPGTVTDCDIIIVEDHGHGTHYDPDTVAAVQKRTGAMVVGNGPVKTAMLNRGVPSSKIVELSPTLGGTASATDVAGCNITSIGMVHTMATSVQVNTFYVEMPSGIKWFHGACASSSSYNPYIKDRQLLDDLDMMALDFEHDFDTVWDEKAPNLLFKTHTFSGTGEGYYWDRDPSSTAQTRIDHNDTYRYVTPLPNVAPVLAQGQASPLDVTEDDPVTFKVLYTDANDDAPSQKKVFIRRTGGATTEHELTPVASGSSWVEGKWLQSSTKLAPGEYTFRFEARDGQYLATGDVGWNPATVTVSPRNQVPDLSSPGFTPSSGDTDTVFHFDVLYRDADNDAAASAQVIIDGTAHEMSTDSPSGPWTDWVTFHFETTLDVGENHRYHLLFSDGEDQVRYPPATSSPNWLAGPVVERPNHPPTLTAALSTPSQGDRDTEFSFSVVYTDTEGDRPLVTFLYLDGTAHAMIPSGTDYVAGVTFAYRTRLDIGTHGYHFVFNDGRHDVRFPEAGELEGPDVANRPPTAVIAQPSSGQRFEPDEHASFRATGSDDPDGDPLEYTWTSSIDGPLGQGEALDVTLSEGAHTVELRVEDPFGGVHTATVEVLVKPYLPRVHVVAIEASIERPVEGDGVRLTIQLANDGEAGAVGTPVEVLVDGEVLSTDVVSVDVGATRTVTATWNAQVGPHTVRVEVGDESGELELDVAANTPPVAAPIMVNPSERFRIGDELYFKANAQDAEGDALAFSWDFGDGGTSDKASPSHVYQQPGTYTVTLTVEDTRGGTTTESFTVEISKPEREDESPGPGALMALAALGMMLLVRAARMRR